MSILRGFERRLEDLVEGFFASAFRSGLQPVELAKRIMREMDAGKTVGVHDVWAPNRFVISLSEEDARRFERAEQALASELARVVRETARERGFGLVGPPRVEFRVDPGLSVGRFRCEGSFEEGPEEPIPEPGVAATLVLLQDGRSVETFRLGQAATIGRLPACEIVLSDPAVSRRHARIVRRGDAFVLIDLGSTNGTLVNGEPVGERELQDGDRITVGTTVLEFRRD
ncbi:MAG: phosphopeptide-binding protein [Actinomycetota bacterium]|nr:MAG: phosphopeptide-binding protein [Actinomycetota bacterium]